MKTRNPLTSWLASFAIFLGLLSPTSAVSGAASSGTVKTTDWILVLSTPGSSSKERLSALQELGHLQEPRSIDLGAASAAQDFIDDLATSSAPLGSRDILAVRVAMQVIAHRGGDDGARYLESWVKGERILKATFGKKRNAGSARRYFLDAAISAFQYVKSQRAVMFLEQQLDEIRGDESLKTLLAPALGVIEFHKKRLKEANSSSNEE